MKCCDNHPNACGEHGAWELIWLVLALIALGWKWVAIIYLVTHQIDWLIRLWKHKGA